MPEELINSTKLGKATAVNYDPLKYSKIRSNIQSSTIRQLPAARGIMNIIGRSPITQSSRSILLGYTHIMR